jgi:branched-chain amino acid transport system substrate-binding protein
MAREIPTGRRAFLRLASAGSAATLAGLRPARAHGQGQAGRPIKIGYVSPQTGPLAGFGEADAFVIGGVRKSVGKGLAIRGRTHPVEILVPDGRIRPERAMDA